MIELAYSASQWDLIVNNTAILTGRKQHLHGLCSGVLQTHTHTHTGPCTITGGPTLYVDITSDVLSRSNESANNSNAEMQTHQYKSAGDQQPRRISHIRAQIWTHMARHRQTQED